MGKCLTIVKLVGIGSLGLSTSILSLSTFKLIPEIELSLQNDDSSSAELKTVFQKTSWLTRISIVGLNFVGATMFTMAFRASPSSGKHPYLIYVSLCGVSALSYYLLKVLPIELSLDENLSALEGKKGSSIAGTSQPKKKVVKKMVKKGKTPPEEERSPLDNSVYNDLGKESELASVSSYEEVEVEVEEDGDDIKEVANDRGKIETLELKSAIGKGLVGLKEKYLYGGAITGTGLLLSVVGYSGDYM